MEKLLNKAIEALKTLPDKDQSKLAWEIIGRVEDKTEWDGIVSNPASQIWLEKEAAAALVKYKATIKPLSMSYISLSDDNLLRGEGYWRHFEDLTDGIKASAEKNYKLWKNNPHHPDLKFKKIHAKLPIFSFRVGKKHRAVGVDVADGKFVWFWLGAIDQFIDLRNSFSALK